MVEIDRALPSCHWKHSTNIMLNDSFWDSLLQLIKYFYYHTTRSDVGIKTKPTNEQREYTKELTKTLKEAQPECTEDIGDLIGSYLPNQDELSNESTCSRKLTHQGITDNWIYYNPGSELEVIGVTSWQTGFRVPAAIGPKIELHSPPHSQSGPQTTWRLLMGLSWFQEAQETENQQMDTKVITPFPERVCLVPIEESARPGRFSNIQNYLWRPGEPLNQSRESYTILQYTNIHRIRRILPPSILPSLGMFTLCVITSQRLGLCYSCNLSVDSVNQDIPRHHIFMPKLSRYKE